MCKETTKSKLYRLTKGHFDRYLYGKGIDIGSGNDPLTIYKGSVDTWDIEDGDAMYMEGAKRNYYDFVYSSHCLEHLIDVETALKNWIELLKPNGYLFVVVPDFSLYEKHKWPSQFNSDHKNTFSLVLDRSFVNRHNHYHIYDIQKILNKYNCNIVECGLEDYGYNYLNQEEDQTLKEALCQIYFVGKKLA